MQIKKSTIHTFLIILTIFLLGFLFRAYVIRENSILFWYDQGRDFAVARELLGGNLKLFGPRASGTHDTIYHGVLYYYLLAPLIYLFNGNIQFITLGLAFFSSLAVLPIYFLSKALTKSKTFAYLAAFLYAFSFEAAQMGTWLSNPFFLIVTIPTFYYFLYLTFFEKKTKYLAYCTLFLGLSNQGSIHTIYLWTSFFIAYWYASNLDKKKMKFQLKNLLLALTTYLLTTSTIIISQAKLVLSGIYPRLEPFVGPPGIDQKLGVWLNIFGGLASLIYTPFLPMLSLVLVCIVFYWFFANKKYSKQQVLVLLTLLAPLSLLALQERQNYHFLIGLSPILLIVLTIFLHDLSKKIFGKCLVIIVILVYLANNFLVTQKIQHSKIHITNDQNEGAMLADQYELIDRTYEVAAGQPFTIGIFSTPYNLYSAWFYLYRYYALPKYGYLPDFIGADQHGQVTADYLKRVDHPEKFHFSIYEPVIINKMPKELVEFFRDEEKQRMGADSKYRSLTLGTLQLEIREKAE